MGKRIKYKLGRHSFEGASRTAVEIHAFCGRQYLYFSSVEWYIKVKINACNGRKKERYDPI